MGNEKQSATDEKYFHFNLSLDAYVALYEYATKNDFSDMGTALESILRGINEYD